MLKLLIALSSVSAVLYLFLVSKGWLGQIRGAQTSPATPERAYFWGLAFVVLFYYGFPVWWWRYGLRNALKLMAACVISVWVILAFLRGIQAVHVRDLGESVAIGLLVAVPVRAATGLWVARNDARWRSAIVAIRTSRKAREHEIQEIT